MLEERVLKLEKYSRYPNLLVTGVSENVTDLEKWFDETFLSLYELEVDNIDIDKIHRIGRPPKPPRRSSTPTRLPPRPRKVLIKFQTHSGRDKIWYNRRVLANTGYFLDEDLPEGLDVKRKPLIPMASICKAKGRKATVVEDYLLVDGIRYTFDKLDMLPEPLQEARYHTLTTTNQVSFLGYLGPLSNFYKCKFDYNNVTYTSSEQFIQVTKASLFPDNEGLVHRMMNTHEPLELKKLGSSVRNYDDGIWKERAIELLLPGLKRKFQQNPHCGAFLINTGNRLIVEASRSDTLFGIGQGLGSPTLLNRETHIGKNIQGNMLMSIRDDLSRV